MNYKFKNAEIINCDKNPCLNGGKCVVTNDTMDAVKGWQFK